MTEAIERHCREVNRCNQRDGRMLSVFDLLDAGTLDMELAAYLMVRISKGASFMVGAVPGGAGKTTVMCALLNFLPADVQLVPATEDVVQKAKVKGSSQRQCYLCHEIGSGGYYAYLWGSSLQDYCSLSQHGHILATNLHAEDIDQARYQMCVDSKVPSKYFKRFELLIFLGLSGGWRDTKRHVSTVFAGDGISDHVQIYGERTGLQATFSGAGQVDRKDVARCREFIERAYTNGVRTIEQTRGAVVDFLESNQRSAIQD